MKKKVIRASGGIVERTGKDGLRIAIVRRKRYRDRDGSAGDWVLPKGKPSPGEKSKETAIREVEEETGCAVELKKGSKLTTEYSTGNGNHKIVTFFPMEYVKKVGPPDASEIAKVKWLSPSAALKRLTYDTERKLIRKRYPDAKRK